MPKPPIDKLSGGLLVCYGIYEVWAYLTYDEKKEIR